MFHAVYKNGVVVERSSFEMLPKSEEVLFFAKSEGDKSHTEYSIIDSCGEPITLTLNGCRLIGCELSDYQGYPYINLEFEISGHGAEKLQIWREEWKELGPLSTIAHIIGRINQCGYTIYLEVRELEKENRQLKWENKDLKEDMQGLERHCHYLNGELMKAEEQLKHQQ